MSYTGYLPGDITHVDFRVPSIDRISFWASLEGSFREVAFQSFGYTDSLLTVDIWYIGKYLSLPDSVCFPCSSSMLYCTCGTILRLFTVLSEDVSQDMYFVVKSTQHFWSVLSHSGKKFQ